MIVFLEFQTGTSAAAHSTLDTKQLISHSRTVLVDTIASLQDSDGAVIPALEVHDLCTNIHNILDNAVSQWAGILAHILTYFLNSVSKQCCEVWASQFCFLDSIKDSVPPSEACLYGCINWPLAQVHHQYPLGLSQLSTSMMGARAKQEAGFQFHVQKQPVQEFGGILLAKKPHLVSKPDGHQGSKKSPRGAATSTTDSRMKESHGGHHS